VRVMSCEIDEPNEVASRLRSMWFAGVAEIADIDLQRRKWLDPTNTLILGDTLLNPQIDPHRPLVVLGHSRSLCGRLPRSLDLGIE
jgi:hypothetical protein